MKGQMLPNANKNYDQFVPNNPETEESLAEMRQNLLDRGKPETEREAELQRKQQPAEPDEPKAKPKQKMVLDDEGTAQPEADDAEQDTEHGETAGESLSIEDRLDLLEKENEAIRAQRDSDRREIEKWKYLHQRKAGELDFIRKNTGGRQTDQAADDPWADLQYEEPQETQSRNVSRQISETEAEVIATARTNVTIAFLEKHQEVYTQGEQGQTSIDPLFLEHLAEAKKDYEDELERGSVGTQKKVTNFILNDAYAAWSAARKLQTVEEARKKRAITSQKARDRKVESQATESSGQSRARVPSADKSFESMTLEEKRKLLAGQRQRTGI